MLKNLVSERGKEMIYTVFLLMLVVSEPQKTVAAFESEADCLKVVQESTKPENWECRGIIRQSQDMKDLPKEEKKFKMKNWF